MKERIELPIDMRTDFAELVAQEKIASEILDDINTLMKGLQHKINDACNRTDIHTLELLKDYLDDLLGLD